ncbi:MAG: hypothetical protein LH610_08010 [Sphingomonas bacterium]|nr:hypothetical protein [Sphingomonas bacterium]
MIQNDKKMSDEELVKNVIARYGEVIDLRKTPHVILEILKTHRNRVAEAPDAGVSVAGVGSPPGPAHASSSLGNVVDNVQLMKEILKVSKQVGVLTERIEKMSAK